MANRSFRYLPLAMAALLLPVPVRAQPADPEAAQRQQALKAVGEFARNYLDQLPDFTCLRVTQHFIRNEDSEDWKKQVKVSEELSYYGRQEHYRIVAVNDAAKTKVPRFAPFTSTRGNFGGFIRAIFESESGVTFDWQGSESVRGKRTWTFLYRVPSGYTSKNCKTVFFVGTCKSSNYPYHGLIYISQDEPAILRLTVEPEDAQPLDQGSRSIDYDRVAIAGVEYLLPIADTFERLTGEKQLRNESVYREYRKFTTDSSFKPAPDGDR